VKNNIKLTFRIEESLIFYFNETFTYFSDPTSKSIIASKSDMVASNFDFLIHCADNAFEFDYHENIGLVNNFSYEEIMSLVGDSETVDLEMVLESDEIENLI